MSWDGDDFELEPRVVVTASQVADDSWIDKEDGDTRGTSKSASQKSEQHIADEVIDILEDEEDDEEIRQPRRRRSMFADDEAGEDKDEDEPLFDDEDEDGLAEKGDEPASSRASSRSKDTKRKKSTRLELDSDDNTNLSADLGAIKKRYGFSADGPSALEEYGFGSADAPVGNDKPPATDFGDLDILSKPLDDFLADPLPKSTVTHSEYRPPAVPSRFVSGATPDSNSHRYLKWNTYGVVRSFANETGSSIEIEFHDSTIHPEIVLDNDSTRFSLADISNKAVALASQEDGEEISELLVIHVTAWDADSRRWTATMPKKDGAIDVLVSNQLVVVITKQHRLRTFTLTGTQRHILEHTGSLLTAAIFEYQLAVCSVVGEYFTENRKKAVEFTHSLTLYSLDRSWHKASSNVSVISLPLNAATHITWLAFTNRGQLTFMDDYYTFHVRSPSGLWMPIFEGASELKSKSDSLWPIAVLEAPNRNIRYLYNRGSKFPLVSLKTAPIIVDWALPFCAADSDKSKLEQEILLNELSQSEANAVDDVDKLATLQISHLQSLIKLFALACKSEREPRAAELAEFVGSAKGIQMMCNYAAKLRKTALADKIAAIGQSKMESSAFEMDSVRQAQQRADRETTQDMPIAPRRSLVINKRKRPSNYSSMASVAGVGGDEEMDSGDERSQDFGGFTSSRGISPRPSESDRATTPLSQQPNDSQLTIRTEGTELSTSQMITHANIAQQRISRNPFKKNIDLEHSPSSLATCNSSASTPRQSFFAELETAASENGKKRSAVLEKEPSKKQAKLSFGTQQRTIIDKENEQSASPFSLWLEVKEAELKVEFVGEADDFPKYCMQKFRMLTATEKKIWKDKATNATAV